MCSTSMQVQVLTNIQYQPTATVKESDRNTELVPLCNEGGLWTGNTGNTASGAELEYPADG